MASRLCLAGHYYSKCAVTELPRALSLGNHAVTCDYLRDADLGAIFRLTQKAAKLGDNVGVDEYPDEDALRGAIYHEQPFVLRYVETGNIAGLLSLGMSAFSRTYHPALCNLRLVLAHTLMTPDAIADAIGLAETLVTEGGCDWQALGTMVSIVQVNAVSALRRHGYLMTCLVPDCIEIAGKGLVQCWCFYKQLQQGLPKMITKEQTKSITDTFTKLLPQLVNIEPFPGLPVRYELRNGHQVHLRNANPDDLDMMYSMTLDAAARGVGVGTDELPTLDSFRYLYTEGACSVIIEDVRTGRVMGYISMGTSPYVRTSRRTAATVITIMLPEYQGDGRGGEMVELQLSMVKQLGFRWTASDTTVTHVKMMNWVHSRKSVNAWGMMPNAIHLDGEGFSDPAICGIDMNLWPNLFTDLLAQQSSKPNVKLLAESKL